MAFFEQTRRYFILFILLGFWTCWPNSKYKRLLRFHSVFSIVLMALNFTSTLIFKRFYSFESFSDLIANFLFISAIFSHAVILFESMCKTQTQLELLKKFSIVNHLLTKKLRVKIFQRTENREIFLRILLMVIVQVVFRIFITVYGTYWKWAFDFLYVALFPEVIIGFKLIQILFFVYIMNVRLRLLNRQLQSIYRKRCWDDNEQNSDFIDVKLPTFKRILALKQTYGALHDICDRISVTFAWSSLAIILYIFMNLTFNTYWVFINLTQIKNLILNVILMTPNFIVLSTVAMYCSSSSEQVRKRIIQVK